MFPRPRTALVLTAAILGAGGLAGCGDDEGAAAGDCDYAINGVEPARAVETPGDAADLADSVTATLELSQGTVTVEMTPDETPCTVNNFVSLAEQGYFDDTVCHRISLGLTILQCGDPTGQGNGNPGYSIPDELSGNETYGAGTVAMANTGSPDTGSAQFFLVYGNADLPPEYTVFGQMDESSTAVLSGIGQVGTDSPTGDGPPKEQVTLESVTVS